MGAKQRRLSPRLIGASKKDCAVLPNDEVSIIGAEALKDLMLRVCNMHPGSIPSPKSGGD